MKKTAFPVMVLCLFLLGPLEKAYGGFMDMFSGLTGRTSNDAKVSADNYAPDVAKALLRLKGKVLHLADFTNGRRIPSSSPILPLRVNFSTSSAMDRLRVIFGTASRRHSSRRA